MAKIQKEARCNLNNPNTILQDGAKQIFKKEWKYLDSNQKRLIKTIAILSGGWKPKGIKGSK